MPETLNMDINSAQISAENKDLQRTHSDESPLEKILKQIRRTKEFPSISKSLEDINHKLSADPNTSNASELANVILNDLALTNKLLKIVNSAFYGLAAGKVSTVTRAVVVLGFDNIRVAILSLVLFEHFKKKSGISDLKDIIISSFWSGTLARDIAKLDGEVDPEEAFVCAMMSQLGKLLMIYYQPETYRKICERVLVHGEDESKAAKTVTGVTYDELGMAVGKQWNFPTKIRDSMPVLSTIELENKKNPPDKIRVLCSFIKELELTIRNPASKVSCNRKMDQLFKRYQKRIKLTKKQLTSLIKDSLSNIEKHAVAMNLSMAKSTFVNNLIQIFAPDHVVKEISEIAPPVDEQTSENYQLTDLKELKTNSIPKSDKSPNDIIMDGIREINEAMMTDLDVNDVALMSLEVLYRALKFHRALMFIREGNGQQMMVRFGYGHNVKGLIRRVSFKASDDKDLFNLSIKVGKDLIVSNSYDEKLTKLIPQWYRKDLDAPAFIFLPVSYKKICIGAFYADRNEDGAPITENEHLHLSMLRNQLTLAIKFR